MALYFFILLTLLKLAVCLPDPNVKIDIDIDVDDNGCGGGGCNKQSCECGDLKTPHGEYLTEACFQLKCVNGIYMNTGIVNPFCGNCTFGGEPLVYTFDKLNNSRPIGVNGTGEYVMTQHGNFPDEFGVTGHFTNSAIPGVTCGVAGYTDCVNGFIYYEQGGAVGMRFDGVNILVYKNPKYVKWGSLSWTFSPVGQEGQCLSGILAFEQSSIFGGGVDCTIAIGSKGVTVALCKESAFGPSGYPWSYIFAMPSLRSLPASLPIVTTRLQGLCNAWTAEGNQDGFWEEDNTFELDWQCGYTKDHNAGADIRKLCDDSTNSWKRP